MLCAVSIDSLIFSRLQHVTKQIAMGRTGDQHSKSKSSSMAASNSGRIQIPKQSPEKLKAVTQKHILVEDCDNGFKIQRCKYCGKPWTLPTLSPTLWAMHLLDPSKCRKCPVEVRRKLNLDLNEGVEVTTCISGPHTIFWEKNSLLRSLVKILTGRIHA